MSVKDISFKIDLATSANGILSLLGIQGGIEISTSWEVNKVQQQAAWEMYVELVTRIATVEIKPTEALIREAFTSLYKLFDITREILRRYGPKAAKPVGKDKLSFGYIAVVILNRLIRPLLAKWHPLLLDYENKRPAGVSQVEHEKVWDRNNEVRDELNKVKPLLLQYADLLAKAAQVPEIHEITS